MTINTRRTVSSEAERLFSEIAEVRRRRRERFELDMAQIDSEYDQRVQYLRGGRHPGPVIRGVIVAWAVLMLAASLLG